MSAFMDLNITYTADKKKLQSLIETAAHLGYSTVAINYVIEPTVKKKQEALLPACVSELFDTFPIIQGKSRPIKVLNRLTILATDPSHLRPYADYKAFDLVAVLPASEKLFHAATMMFNVDIICITMTEKLPFFLKRAPVNAAIQRGVLFEISYAAAIRDSTMRRYTISNSVSLMERCKGKNVILTSAAETPLELRGPYDIANLGLLFGLSEGAAKEAVSSNCRSVLLHAETRKTASGIIYTMKTSTELPQQLEASPQPVDETKAVPKRTETHHSCSLGEEEDPPAAKRTKTQTD